MVIEFCRTSSFGNECCSIWSWHKGRKQSAFVTYTVHMWSMCAKGLTGKQVKSTWGFPYCPLGFSIGEKAASSLWRQSEHQRRWHLSLPAPVTCCWCASRQVGSPFSSSGMREHLFFKMDHDLRRSQPLSNWNSPKIKLSSGSTWHISDHSLPALPWYSYSFVKLIYDKQS